MPVTLRNDFKEWFFDVTYVDDTVAATNRVGLRRIGGNVRLTARRSIRKRKKASLPGEPPSSHIGDLKERLFFIWDPESESVVVGPEAFNHIYFNGDKRPVQGAVPGILEEGGEIYRLERQWPNGAWTRADLRSRRRLAGRPTRLVKITIEARPYMWPAVETSKSRYAHLWADVWPAPRAAA